MVILHCPRILKVLHPSLDNFTARAQNPDLSFTPQTLQHRPFLTSAFGGEQSKFLKGTPGREKIGKV
jgi:hypothetical protein